MARAKKEPRVLKSKYGISTNTATEAAEVSPADMILQIGKAMESGSADLANVLRSAKRVVEIAQEKAQANATAIEQSIIAETTKLIPDLFLTERNWIDYAGVVRKAGPNEVKVRAYTSLEQSEVVEKANRHRVLSANVSDTMETLNAQVSFMGIDLTYRTFSTSYRESWDAAHLKKNYETLLELADEDLKEAATNRTKLTQNGVEPTEYPVGHAYPLIGTIKTALRDMGFNSRNDSSEIDYRRTRGDSDRLVSIKVRGPILEQSDLRAEVKFKMDIAKLAAYLTRRKLIASEPDETTTMQSYHRIHRAAEFQLVPVKCRRLSAQER